MRRNVRTSDLWTPMDLWIVRASRHLARGRLIPLREFKRLPLGDFDGRLEYPLEGIREFLKAFDPFFREEQKPLLRRSWKRWINWKKRSQKHGVHKKQS